MINFRTQLAIKKLTETFGSLMPEGWVDMMEQGATDAIEALRKSMSKPFRDLAKGIQSDIDSILGTGSIGLRIATATSEFSAMAFDDADYIGKAQELRSLILERYQLEKAEIEGIKSAFESVYDSVSGQLLGMATSSDNPADIFERLGIQLGEVNRLKDLYGSSTGLDQAGYGGQLSTALGDYLKLSQEAFQRPSNEYQAIFDMVTAELSSLQDSSLNQISIAESQLISIQNQAVGELKTIRDTLTASALAIDGINTATNEIARSLQGVATEESGTSSGSTGNTFNISVVVNDNDLIDLKSDGTTTSTIIASIKYAIENGDLRAPIQEVANG